MDKQITEAARQLAVKLDGMDERAAAIAVVIAAHGPTGLDSVRPAWRQESLDYLRAAARCAAAHPSAPSQRVDRVDPPGTGVTRNDAPTAKPQPTAISALDREKQARDRMIKRGARGWAKGSKAKKRFQRAREEVADEVAARNDAPIPRGAAPRLPAAELSARERMVAEHRLAHRRGK
ncbi:MAG: hypothetical protein KIT31_13875 [Deltaproteobacteria bacterium]|nr:hypothetical protein [Deltaproteobacteria bacterium]